MSTAAANTVRPTSFGKRRAAILAAAPRSGVLDFLERLGLGSALGVSLVVMAAILVANWSMG